METFQTLRNSGYAVTFSNAYLEQGRYAQAIASTGAEPALVNEAPPAVTFADATSALMAAGAAKGDDAGGILLADTDNDGHADLLSLRATGLTLLRQDAGGRFVDITAASGIRPGPGTPRTAAWL